MRLFTPPRLEPNMTSTAPFSLNTRRLGALVAGVALFAAALIPYYTHGAIVLGGEGDTVLDFTTYINTFGPSWFSIGLGTPNVGPNAIGLNVSLLLLLERLTGSVAIVNYCLVLAIYAAPFAAMYLTCTQAGHRPLAALALGLFYVANPLVLGYLVNLNQWNVFVLTAMPLAHLFIDRWYRDLTMLFLVYGVSTALLCQAFTNPPLHAAFHLSALCSVLIVSVTNEQGLRLSAVSGRFALLLASFILFNAFWLFNSFSTLADAQKIYSHEFAKTWLDTVVASFPNIFTKTFSLTTFISQNFGPYSTLFGPAAILSTAPLLLLLYMALKSNRDQADPNSCAVPATLILLALAMVALTLMKGTAPPFGSFYSFLFNNIPLFYIFKTPVEKFGLLFFFLLCLGLSAGLAQPRSPRRTVLACLWALITASLIPAAMGQLIPDTNFPPRGQMSRRYVEWDSFALARDLVNESQLYSRGLGLPGQGNYQVAFTTPEGSLYTGIDPLTRNMNKPFISSEHGLTAVFKAMPPELAYKLYGIYNIRHLVLNRTLIPWFGTVGMPTTKDVEQHLHGLPCQDFGKVAVYDNLKDFVPILSAPERLYLVRLPEAAHGGR